MRPETGREMRRSAPCEVEAEAGIGNVVAADEVFIPFSKVHRVVSATIGSRFWQLQEGDSSDDDDLILAEVADEVKACNRPSDVSDPLQGSLTMWVLAGCLGKFTEISSEGVHTGWNPKVGGCGEATPQFPWVAA